MRLAKYLIALIFFGLLLFAMLTLIQNRQPDSEILDAAPVSCAPVKVGPFGIEKPWHPPYKCNEK